MRPLLTLALACLPALAAAEAPRVVTDLPPVHSLVAQVMAGVGEPALMAGDGGGAHDRALSVGEAGTLAESDLVIWVGPELTPWMEEARLALAPEVTELRLLDTPGWEALPLREDPLFHVHDETHEDGDHDHGDGHGDVDDHDHDHAEAHDDGGTARDPHAWLDPAVGRVWLGLIAETLAGADPGNAATYRANAARAAEALETVEAEMEAALAPLAGVQLLLPHDAYRYAEARFGLTGVAAISLSHAAPPGPGHLGRLRDMARAGEIDCILSDPETDANWIRLVREGTEIPIARVDADGLLLQPGPALYGALLPGFASALQDCLTQ